MEQAWVELAAAAACLEHSHLFGGLTPDGVARLAKLARPMALEAGETLFDQGDPVDALYVVASGRLVVCVQSVDQAPREVASMLLGDCVGEIGVLVDPELTEPRRSASVRAAEPSIVLRFGAEAMRAACDRDPDLREAFAGAVNRRLEGLRSHLGKLFGELPETAILDIQASMDVITLHGGDVLMRKGEPGDSVYIVMGGRLEVLDPDGGRDRLADVGVGEAVGEVSLLTGEPRSATVRALRDTVLLRLSSEAFSGVLERYPKAAMPLVRVLARRISAAQRRSKPIRPRVFSLIPASPDVDVRALARGVAPELGDDVIVTGAREFEALHGEGSASSAEGSARLVQWLGDAERTGHVVVFLCDPTPSVWTLLCMRQSDREVLVAASGADPTPGPVERAIAAGRLPGYGGMERLVIVHPADTDYPRGTLAWLEPRPGLRHNHVRAGHARDHRRLGRFLVDRPHGLVLGGGGARGYAHVGVLRGLAELGVEVDTVCGASMGASVATGVALDQPLEQVGGNIVEIIVGTRLRRRITIPMVSFLNIDRVERATERIVMGLNVEDTWLPFFAMSTNLTRNALQVHERGPLWRANRASCALPAILPPALEDGEVLVDGGVLDNLPVLPMRRRCAGPILACDVTAGPTMRADKALVRVPRGGRLFWRKILPFVRSVRMPGLVSIVTQSMVCGSAIQRRLALEAADLTLDPPVDGHGMLDFERYDELEAIGYRYTMESAEAILEVFAADS